MIDLNTREADFEITQFLRGALRDKGSKYDPRWGIVYDRLREIATRLMVHESEELTLTAAALVHEAYFRLLNGKQADWKDRKHFYRLFGRIMRHVLIDYTRKKRADKRPFYRNRIPLQALEYSPNVTIDIGYLDLKRALEFLEMISENLSIVVQQHYLDDLPLEAVARRHDRSLRTIKRELRRARLLLYQFLTDLGCSRQEKTEEKPPTC